MTEPRKHAEQIKAWADGETIQYRDRGQEWLDIGIPSWCRDTQYRIKPKVTVHKLLAISSGKRGAHAALWNHQESNLELTFDEEGVLIKAEVLDSLEEA